MILLLYLNVVVISKDFNLIFYLFIYFFFQNYPLSQYYRDHQFWGVSKTRGRGRGLGRGLSFFFKECCFRIKVRVRLDTNRNPKTAFFRKKIEPDRGTGPDPDPAFLLTPISEKEQCLPYLWNKNLGQFKLRVSDNWKHLRYSRDLRPLNLQLYWWI